MRLVFMGSPTEVVAPLEYLLKHQAEKGHEVVAVVSQPAKPAGRKMVLTDPPLATFAKERGLLCLQPVKASDPLFLDELRALAPDVIITAAYGQILSTSFLSVPARATINIHPSLLPLYRGAIPVPAALLDGRTETGVTVLFTVKALDAGNIIVQETYSIGEDEIASGLTERMFAESGPLLVKALAKLEDPTFAGTPQEESKVTFCKKIANADGAIDWSKDAKTIWQEFRAYQPWPGTYTERQGIRIVIEAMAPAEAIGLKPGEFLYDKKAKALLVGTAQGQLALSRVKSAGSKSMDAAGFWNGLRAEGPQQFAIRPED